MILMFTRSWNFDGQPFNKKMQSGLISIKKLNIHIYMFCLFDCFFFCRGRLSFLALGEDMQDMALDFLDPAYYGISVGQVGF